MVLKCDKIILEIPIRKQCAKLELMILMKQRTLFTAFTSVSHTLTLSLQRASKVPRDITRNLYRIKDFLTENLYQDHGIITLKYKP